MTPTKIAYLIDTHSAALVLCARQWCAEPEDVVQEAFVKLVQQHRFPDDAVAWLYRVVRNGAIDAGKSTRRRRKRESSAARPERWFVEKEIDGINSEAAMVALERLDDQQREVIVAKLWGKLSFEQIAVMVGCSVSSAFRRYTAGVELLRKELRIPCPDHSPKA